MTARRHDIFDAFGRLFRYPGEDYTEHARQLEGLLCSRKSRAGGIEGFVRYVESQPLYDLEEAYTRAFDLNPTCTLEVGWHLFGEEYVRGLFMVRMRNEMRSHGLEETGELPDHVVHVLAVLGAMEPDAARELARACVCPAVGKMLASFDKPAQDQKTAAPAEQPFRPLVESLAEVLLEEFDLPRIALEAAKDGTMGTARPLHRSPCGWRCGGADRAFALNCW
jgi:nitrate reductase delta subunit